MDSVRIMPTRLEGVNDALAGIDKSDTYGIAFTQNNSFFSAGWTDDQGIYIFSQFLHKVFGLNSIDSINLFYMLVLVLGFVFFSIGIFSLFKNIKTRVVSVLTIVVLSLLTYKISDLYIMFYFSSSLLFLFLYIMKNRFSFKSKLLILLIFGILLGISNIFRSHASTAVVLFIISYIFINGLNKSKIIAMITSLIGGLVLTSMLWNITIIQPKTTFLENTKTMTPITTQHPFWHSVYIGLGFIDNPYVGQYLDEVGIEKVKSISPEVKYLSTEYEEILKKETFSFIISHPGLFFQTIGAKFGVMFFYALVFMNIGIYWIIKNITVKEFIPFGLAISFNSLFGFLVIPATIYLLGFIIFVVLFTIYFVSKSFEEKEMINETEIYCNPPKN
jgi:hypothetical protein